MKKKFLMLFLIPFLFSFKCEDEGNIDTPFNKTLLGKWQLIEVLADPGDGSGTFQSVLNGEIIEFINDNSIIGFSEFGDCSSDANFSEETKKITFFGCDFTFSFSLKEENLLIYPPCIEACANKYKKLQ